MTSASANQASERLYATLRNEGSLRMQQALAACDIDGAMFRNMLVYIDHADLEQQPDRSLMLLMLFVVTGCTGNPHTASVITVDYATNVLGSDYHTAQTIFSTPPMSATDGGSITLGLVRITNGHILKGTPMHVLNAAGTTIGLMPAARHTVIDVGEDVSREHARVWREDGRWLICDLQSTNGTRVIVRDTGEIVEVHDTPVELSVTDTVCLSSSTQFLVLPIMDPEV